MHVLNDKLDGYVVLQVRAKYMTLDPAANRYVKYIRNIRTIQVCWLKAAKVAHSVRAPHVGANSCCLTFYTLIMTLFATGADSFCTSANTVTMLFLGCVFLFFLLLLLLLLLLMLIPSFFYSSWLPTTSVQLCNT